MSDEDRQENSSWRATKAVFWGFIGVRRNSHYEEDVKKLKPVQVIVVGLIGAALFVAALVAVVSVVTRELP